MAHVTLTQSKLNINITKKNDFHNNFISNIKTKLSRI